MAFHSTSVHFSQSCLILCNRMDGSTPGLPVHHQLPEFTQTHVHWVDDTIRPSHPPLSPSPPAINLSHQGLFKWVSSLHQVVKVLEFQLQHQSFQWIFRTDFLSNGLVRFPCCSRDSQESSVTPQFKRDNSSVLSLLYGPEKTPLLSLWLVLPMNHRRWDTGVSPLKTLKSFSGFSRFFLFPVVAMQMSAC